jgi:hypothetical protein
MKCSLDQSPLVLGDLEMLLGIDGSMDKILVSV